MIKPYIMLSILLAALAMKQTLPPLHVDGPNLETPDGQIVHLRGCNLGAWFMIEHWLWDEEQPEGGSQDQYELEQILAKRFGEKEKDRLLDVYRASWITDRDFKIIKTFRFNCVRLPMNYRMFEDDANPFHLRKDPWRWTDHAIDLAARNGLYVILDMHGVQGGQNDYDHSGRAHQNKLWTTPEDQDRMAWLWTQMARKYRDNPAVIAYDVFNEPYGGEKADIRKVWEKSYHAIRTVDPEKLVYAMGRYDGFEMYGDPNANGWHNVGIEMHYYPGLFGNGNPTVRTNMQHMALLKRSVVPVVKKLNVPFYVGEMNVVFDEAGGAEMMRRTYDFYESNGWGTTMWTYKALGRSGGLSNMWGMVNNRDPFPKINFATAKESEIEGFFRANATMPYALNTKLQQEMAPEHIALPPIVEDNSSRTTAPQGQLVGWTNTDIGGALPGGLEATASGFNLFGGGADIWADRDQFQFLHQEVDGDFEMTVRINSEEDLGSYCKAGLMVRSDMASSSAFVMMSIFPSGEVQTAVRATDGASAQGSEARAVGFPMEMRIERHGEQYSCSCRKAGVESWTELALPAAPHLGAKVSCGPIALSHDDSQLIKISYTNLTLRDSSENR